MKADEYSILNRAMNHFSTENHEVYVWQILRNAIDHLNEVPRSTRWSSVDAYERHYDRKRLESLERDERSSRSFEMSR